MPQCIAVCVSYLFPNVKHEYLLIVTHYYFLRIFLEFYGNDIKFQFEISVYVCMCIIPTRGRRMEYFYQPIRRNVSQDLLVQHNTCLSRLCMKLS